MVCLLLVQLTVQDVGLAIGILLSLLSLYDKYIKKPHEKPIEDLEKKTNERFIKVEKAAEISEIQTKNSQDRILDKVQNMEKMITEHADRDHEWKKELRESFDDLRAALRIRKQ